MSKKLSNNVKHICYNCESYNNKKRKCKKNKVSEIIITKDGEYFCGDKKKKSIK